MRQYRNQNLNKIQVKKFRPRRSDSKISSSEIQFKILHSKNPAQNFRPKISYKSLPPRDPSQKCGPHRSSTKILPSEIQLISFALRDPIQKFCSQKSDSKVSPQNKFFNPCFILTLPVQGSIERRQFLFRSFPSW